MSRPRLGAGVACASAGRGGAGVGAGRGDDGAERRVSLCACAEGRRGR